MLKMPNDKLLTFEDIPWDILTKYCDEIIPNEIKVHLKPILNVLQLSKKNNEEISKDWIENTLVRLEACVDRTWEALNTGYWRDVPMQQRYCYTICSVLKCMVLEIDSKKHGNNDKKKTEGDKIRVIVEQVDKGLLLGAPLDDAPDLLTKLATRLNEYFASKIPSSGESFFKNNEDNFEKKLLPGLSWLKRHKVPSMETFYREIFVVKLPAVLEDCMQHWNALKLWKDPKYLVKVAGVRTVPVEIGSRYTEEDWSQHLLTLADFIDSHLNKPSEKIGYLAQHQLFDQIPELKDDFSIPDYCNFSDGPEPTCPDINAWFGPKGTVSPLHFDPKNNLLCQVLLYPPSESENLYPFDTRLLTNTAQVDPQNPDYKKFPKFKNAQGSMCFLGPGEMVFIPPGWWHHVVSLSPSFSISFWWT